MEPRLPIACVWQVADEGKSSNTALSVAGTIAVIVGQVVVFVLSTLYLHKRSNPRWMKTVQVVGLFVLLAMGIGVTVRVVLESQAFGHPPASINLVGPSEGSWSFGQLLPLLLLVLPLMSLLEIMRGEMRLAPNKMSDESVPLYSNAGDMEFQPHPLAASATNLFKR